MRRRALPKGMPLLGNVAFAPKKTTRQSQLRLPSGFLVPGSLSL
jgi:hypothetical protein